MLLAKHSTTQHSTSQHAEILTNNFVSRDQRFLFWLFVESEENHENADCGMPFKKIIFLQEER